MTKEELIRYGKDYLHDLVTACCQISDIHKEFVRESLKALEQQPCDDCVSRQAVLDCLTATGLKKFDFILDAREKVNNLPPVTPTHGTCKDCRWLTTDENDNYYCKQTGDFDSLDWYCADFEK